MNNPTWHSGFWFALILIMIPLGLWLVKRSAMGIGLRGAPGAAVRLVSSTALSPTQRIVTVEVGEGEEKRWLVLGVTPQAINTLHTLSVTQVLPTEPTEKNLRQDAFSQLLKRLRTGAQRES